MNPLTVEELIEKLQDLPLTAKVMIEGCDCRGLAVDVGPAIWRGNVVAAIWRNRPEDRYQTEA